MTRHAHALMLAIAATSACSGRGSTTRPSSAQMSAAGSPSLRVVDNAGYVDPGGRTRQVSAGAAPAPVGRGEAVAPLEREHATGPPAPAPAASGSAPTPPSDEATELVARAARALCDRETVCGRVGAGKTFESPDACAAAKRERVRAVLDEASCGEIRGDRVGACLTAIRAAPCGPRAAVLEPPRECTRAALCGPSAFD